MGCPHVGFAELGFIGEHVNGMVVIHGEQPEVAIAVEVPLQLASALDLDGGAGGIGDADVFLGIVRSHSLALTVYCTGLTI